MRRLALVAVATLALAACSNDPGDPPVVARDVTGITDPTMPGGVVVGELGDPAAPSAGSLEYTIDWSPLDGGREEGWLTVPVDYTDPQGDTIDLYVARHAAANDSVGPLLANRGGPGAEGASLALDASGYFRSAITDNFDVIGWDPRGTGRSEGVVDCIDDADYDRFFAARDITPDDEAERETLVDLAEEFAERCAERVEHLDHVGTNNSARDMDAIRQALGAEQVSYFGFSYGSELGGVWATMYPSTVRATVFDGALDPNASSLDVNLQQGAGFEAALETFLAGCSADSNCAFHNDGDAAGAFDRLMASLDESPIPSVDGRPLVDLGVAVDGVVQAMYSDTYWPALERALEDAAAGDGAGLLQLRDLYYGRGADGVYENTLEAFRAINCADDAARPSVEESDAAADEVLAVAPRTFPFTTGSYSCTFFPPAVEPRIDITGAGAGPIVVIGTTGDSATPLESSRAMAETLEDGRLVIVDANRHTGYLRDECVQAIVHEYLLQLTPPADGTECA